MMPTYEPLIRLHQAQILEDCDLAFADLIGRMAGTDSEAVLLAAALAFAAQREGHTCLNLSTLAGRPYPCPDLMSENRVNTLSVDLPDIYAWRESLCEASNVIAIRGDNFGGILPLVLDEKNRLYLRRFYQQEQSVACKLKDMAETVLTLPKGLTNGRLGTLLAGAFDNNANWQKLACYLALTRQFFILSGGPGTGKTYTMARIAAILLTANNELRIRFAAPTGKAANRIAESVREAKQGFPEILADGKNIPNEAETLHRLLGASADGRRLTRNKDNPIDADVVIVDEASMIALPMMSALLNALPPACRLILLGDMDQLASVDPGAVLADICRASGPTNKFSKNILKSYSAATQEHIDIPGASWDGNTGLGDCLVALKESRRFPDDHPVAKLSRVIHDAQDEIGAKAAFCLLEQNLAPIKWNPIRNNSLLDGEHYPCADFREVIWEGYLSLLNAETPGEALRALKNFRILCVLRRGPFGVDALNRMAEHILAMDGIQEAHKSAEMKGAKRLLPRNHRIYPRQPLMILRNDYGMGLFNGDVGVVMEDQTGELMAWFETIDRDDIIGCRSIPVNLLPPWESAFASTVHKSQGSEFSNLAIVLPPAPVAQMTKELLYTAITRIKPDQEYLNSTGKIHLWSTEESFITAVYKSTSRSSGLTDLL